MSRTIHSAQLHHDAPLYATCMRYVRGEEHSPLVARQCEAAYAELLEEDVCLSIVDYMSANFAIEGHRIYSCSAVPDRVRVARDYLNRTCLF
ncbi:hypothetical protein [Mollivirus kamchatka]|nr:hypothetical protein [Mollivirus kamchatka]